MTEIELLEQGAVDAALSQKWDYAIDMNKRILKLDKENLGAQLRLAFIYLQNNQLKEAKRHYRAVLKIQPSNMIATGNLDKITILEEDTGKGKKVKRELNLNPNLFLEIPGKTKSVSLINPGQKVVLAKLTIGEEVYIKTKARKIEVRTGGGDYLGSLADDLSKRLLLFIKGGSVYKAYVKEVSLSQITIFIQEVEKGKKVQKYTSFPKNMQQNITRLVHADDENTVDKEEEEQHIENDLDRLAEIMTEEKDFLHETHEDEDEEDQE